MALIFRITIIIPAVLLLLSCGSVQHISKSTVEYTTVSQRGGAMPDEDITAMLSPYKEKIDSSMSEVVGEVAQEMSKGKPESPLGNWYCDALLEGARETGHPVDFAISNYGGLRVPYLAAGPLTRGELFELSPFDNILVIVAIPGHLLDSLMQRIAAAEGWPVSKGITMTIKDQKISRLEIDGQPLNPERTYQVAMPDYVANGGDDMSMLIPLPRIYTGLMQRDIVISYAQYQTRMGQKISASKEGRIVNER